MADGCRIFISSLEDPTIPQQKQQRNEWLRSFASAEDVHIISVEAGFKFGFVDYASRMEAKKMIPRLKKKEEYQLLGPSKRIELGKGPKQKPPGATRTSDGAEPKTSREVAESETGDSAEVISVSDPFSLFLVTNRLWWVFWTFN